MNAMYTTRATATGGREVGEAFALAVCPYSNATRNNVEVKLSVE